MAWLASVSVWGGIYQNGQQQYAQLTRIKRMDRQMYIMIFRNWRSSSNWHQAHDGMLYYKYRCVRSVKTRSLLGWLTSHTQELRSTCKSDRRVFSNSRWFDEFAKRRGKPASLCSCYLVNTNRFQRQYTSNKGFAEDLTEGKFSFPVVHGIHADKSNRQVMSK